jgi:peptide/nickel transport system permease protein
MAGYLLKRILVFIPTLLVISLLTHIISINAPGDPVDMMLNGNGASDGQIAQLLSYEKSYDELRHELHLDLPVFYFSVSSLSIPDTLYKISKVFHRETLKRLAFTYGNWPEVSNYYLSLRDFEKQLYEVSKNFSNADMLKKTKGDVYQIYLEYDTIKIFYLLNELEISLKSDSSFQNIYSSFQNLKSAFGKIMSQSSFYKSYIPTLHWHGFKNQYHHWITHFLIGDFGISYQDKRSVSGKLKEAIGWTLILSFMSIILSYLIAVPLGVISAAKKGQVSEKIISVFLFMLYSLPSFWIGTLAIIFLGGGDYLDWFPAFGITNLPDDAPFWERFTDIAYHFVLPVFCLFYNGLAFISRQQRSAMLNTLTNDYIRTARAKGLGENKIIWKHAFRNSLIPVITLFANFFPAVVSGSFVIEYLFSIPGMGKLSYDALIFRDYPLVFTTLMLVAIMAMIGNLLADFLYARVDPRISFDKK